MLQNALKSIFRRGKAPNLASKSLRHSSDRLGGDTLPTTAPFPSTHYGVQDCICRGDERGSTHPCTHCMTLYRRDPKTALEGRLDL